MTVLLVATHSGCFHADDVLAWAFIRHFVDAEAKLVRTRDTEILAEANIVIDVGGAHDPEQQRFDHHQPEYTGTRSSAGMVLDWLETRGRVASDLASYLRDTVVDYVDAVDTGRQAPRGDVPCFCNMVTAHTQGCVTMEDFDRAFAVAGEMARQFVVGLEQGHQARERTRAVVESAMEQCLVEGSNVLIFDRSCAWHDAFFDAGGRDHPAQFVVLPSVDGSWRAVAVPPTPHSFEQRRSMPASWAGLRDAALQRVTGVAGAIFCHKNLFLAVFRSREDALEALALAGLIRKQDR